jgi:flavin-dependent dehydrogenase
VESGLLAAQAILAARGRRREDLLPYARALEERLGPRGRHRRLPSALTRWVAPTALATPWFARHVVLDRFFLAGTPGGRLSAP